ncbi:tetratricopeptide (TPR) repeat protein [Saccharothrix tamanrassetensis]|uniref:Tetratricopeptide (TPR) repeat protein n=1 Tax=Saccharothrix tamanrassetensis TaxID=1051531 RepID=A0A841CCW8_9PSEU|nr:tetratricopeptide repeat protein [Saccharothrix tamanrassetensis]MBB5955091.1 tetratricopeptide (TPR) repeat protein [Saccharothrix tamanrassetensis]
MADPGATARANTPGARCVLAALGDVREALTGAEPMTVEGGQGETGRSEVGPGGDEAGTGRDNRVVADAVTGLVVQAETVAGGITVHVPQPEPALPRPRQLPSVPHAFVGRDHHLARLTGELGGATVVVSAAQVGAPAGPGGIGKTWLALEWAHRNLDRFPDGQLFVDLHGFSPAGRPVEPATAVRGFLEASDVAPARIPAALDAQATLFRSLVADKRMLIMLDNAADADQVLPLLLGGSSCTVMITSRRHLTRLVTRHGARHLPLDVLSDAEARELLTRRLGADRIAAEPAAVAELLACCAGFPPALAVVAGRAHTNPEVPPAEAAAELRDATTRLVALDDDDPAAGLPAVLSWSVRALTDDQATVYGLLGVAPGPDIGLAAAAGLTGMPASRTAAVLRGLEQASLLGRDRAGRYRMHDLIRLHARDHARTAVPEEVRRTALRRLVDSCLHTADAGDRQIRAGLVAPVSAPDLPPPSPGSRPQSLPDAEAAMVWFEAEHACLLAAQWTAAELGRHDLVPRFAWALNSFQHRRGDIRGYLAAWQASLAVADRLEAGTRWMVHRTAAHALALSGQAGEALHRLDLVLTATPQVDDVVQRAVTHHVVGLAAELAGDVDVALDHAGRALRIAEDSGEPSWVAHALVPIARCTALAGHADRAREHARRALDLHRRAGDAFGEAGALDALGLVDHVAGRHAAAVASYRESRALFERLGYRYETAVVLDRLGQSQPALGQPAQARVTWREALELYRAQGRDDEAARLQRRFDALG